jgi:hypothetical protein
LVISLVVELFEEFKEVRGLVGGFEHIAKLV